MTELLLAFDDERHLAEPLAVALGAPLRWIERHAFPDGESRLRLPAQLPRQVALLRGLQQPNQKLAELMIVAPAARELGASRLTLVCPYLAYMRQDMAFQPGEAVSQRHIGQALATWFDHVITVDPHLHRVATLDEAVPVPHAIALSGAPMLADLVARHHASPVLIGPDAESAQWIDSAAAGRGWRHGVCTKARHGDRDVRITLPELDVRGQAVVLIDDVASSGRTLGEAARLLLAAGAQSVDAAVTHALFADDALGFMQRAGIRHVWSTDCIAHPSNAAPMAPLLAEAVRTVQQALRHNTAPR